MNLLCDLLLQLVEYAESETFVLFVSDSSISDLKIETEEGLKNNLLSDLEWRNVSLKTKVANKNIAVFSPHVQMFCLMIVLSH